MGNNNLPQGTISPQRNPSGQTIGTIGRWERLIARSAPGKSSVLRYSFTGNPNAISPVPNLQVNGANEDTNATQICLTLSKPEVINATAVPAGLSAENITQTQDTANCPVGEVWAAPFADVSWGIGGQKNKARVDILNGLCVNLTASWLTVEVGVESSFDTTAQYYRLASFVGPGTSKSNDAQRTILVDSYSVGVSGVKVLPAFAKRLWVIDNAATVDAGTITFSCDRSGAIPMSKILRQTGQYGPFPIPSQAYFFKYTVGAGTPRVSFVFDLGI